MSIPIGMSPTLNFSFFAYEEIEKYNNFFICKKEDTPKTSNKTTKCKWSYKIIARKKKDVYQKVP
jgi:hypothetical protein